MTLLFYAQPYDVSAVGFYFHNAAEYDKQAAPLKNCHGDTVKEFAIQFIDGERIDCELAKAWELNQSNLAEFIDFVDDCEDEQKLIYIIAVTYCGIDHSSIVVNPYVSDVVIYWLDSLKELAGQFVEDGLFGEIPERVQSYLDYEAIARDLAVEYSEIEIAGQRLIFRCA